MADSRPKVRKTFYRLGISVLLISLFFSCRSRLRSDSASFVQKSNVKDLFQEHKVLAHLEKRGPVEAIKHKFNIVLGDKTSDVVGDFYYSDFSADKGLVLIQHGNHSKKEAHSIQAMHLASWGLNVLTLQQKNTKNWMRNGEKLAEIVRGLYAKRFRLPGDFDHEKIILIGHSFGGSAISIAAGQNAPIIGMIYLDPAIVSDKVKHYLSKVQTPAIVLGADREVFRSRKRDHFFKYLNGDRYEVSVVGATHDDAQAPSMYSIYAYGADPYTDGKKRRHFMGAMTLSALSLQHFGDLAQAWPGFQAGVVEGTLKKPRMRISNEAL